MRRVALAARLHTLGWHSLSVPYSVMFSALLVNFVIFGLLRGFGVDENEAQFTGGLLSLYITVGVMFVVLVNEPFRFALGFSLTRRAYLSGTALFALGLALGSGVFLYLMRLLEQLTGGWFLQLEFFEIGGWYTGDPISQIIGYAAPMLAISAFGALLGGFYARWGTIGVWGVLTLITLVVILFILGVTLTQNWMSVGQWFVDQPMVALLAGYPWAITAVLGAATYLLLRKVNA
ncbi:hypothetical protein GCM10027456_19390 [Kineosporia babensis]